MKVLIVGSDSIHVSGYIKALSEQETEIYMLSEDKCKFEGVIEHFHVNFRRLHPLAIFLNYKSLKRIIEEIQPDIVHIHQINRLAYFVTRACFKKDIPCVSTAWGSDVLIVPLKNRFFHFLVRQSLSRSAFVTADSLEMIEAMEQIIPYHKYIHLQYGIDMIEACKKEKIIYSNRLHKKLYRIDKVIEYFEEISKDFPEYKLVIAGSGVETENLKLLVHKCGIENRVEFVGWVNQAENSSWYAKSDIYISIPESDGTSVSLLEAMSAECFPIVPNLAVSKEWIVDGENGIIESIDVNPIRRALQLDRRSSAKGNRDLIHRKASRVNSLKAFIQLYNKAIND